MLGIDPPPPKHFSFLRHWAAVGRVIRRNIGKWKIDMNILYWGRVNV